MGNYTVAVIKKELISKGDKSGFFFSSKNPYYANDERLKCMRREWGNMTEIDDLARKKQLISKPARKSICSPSGF